MHTGYGGFLRAGFEWVFGPIHYPPKTAETVRALSQEGTIVYITKARSAWLVLYFNHALTRLGLPLAHFVGGFNLLIWQPLGKLLKLLLRKRRQLSGPWRARFKDRNPKPSERVLADIASRGLASFLVMKPKKPGKDPHLVGPDFIRTLIAVQQDTSRPIYLVAHVVIDHSFSGSSEKGIADRLFGDRRNPGRLRQMAMLLSLRRASVRVAQPINLKDAIREHPDFSDVQLSMHVTQQVEHLIHEEERVIAGGDLPPWNELQARVLGNRTVQKAILGTGHDESFAARQKAARGYLRQMAARYSLLVVQLSRALLSLIFHRIYSGIVIDEPGMRGVIEASRGGPLVYCPCHRSHVDYLVLSYVLAEKGGVTPPHIAAGENLSFFPLGWLFRRGGAFFLKRSFGDNALYTAVFKAYVAELLRAGTSLEFFPEGTRSRTGKLLMPKFGMFNMVVNAWRQGVQDDILFVPVSIDYERIIEAGAYQKEIAGGQKQKEDVTALLKTASVLTSRYGRVHLQFGDPISLKEIAQRKNLPQSPDAQYDGVWRKETERLGYRVLHQVATVCSVTPLSVAATALLGHPKRGMSQSAFLKEANNIIEFLDGAAARLSTSLLDVRTRNAAVLEAIRELVEDELIKRESPGETSADPVYLVPDDKRVQLDFYKNAVMNYFAPVSVSCRAMLAQSDLQNLDYQRVHDDARFLSKLFKREFLYRADSRFDTYFDDSLASLVVRGLIDVPNPDRIVVKDETSVRLLAGLLDPFVQAYLIVFETLEELKSFPLWDDEIKKLALERTRRAYLEGKISRPEAANQSLISSAITWLRIEGVLGGNEATLADSLHHETQRFA